MTHLHTAHLRAARFFLNELKTSATLYQQGHEHLALQVFRENWSQMKHAFLWLVQMRAENWQVAQQALGLYAEVGNLDGLLADLAFAAYQSGDFQMALDTYEYTDELTVRDQRAKMFTSIGLALVHGRLGNRDLAYQYVCDGLERALEFHDTAYQVGFVIAAMVLVEPPQAAQWAGMVAQQPMLEAEFQQELDRILDDLEKSLGSASLQVEMERGKTLDLATITRQILQGKP